MSKWESSNPLSPHVDVAEYNSLPRTSDSPLGLSRNHWHFDVRFIPFEPNPAHVLFLVHPDSGHHFTEFLPIGIPPAGDHHAWFAETSSEAAPQVAKTILQCFLTGHRHGPAEITDTSLSDIFFAPWSLSTDSGVLAAAVEQEMKRLQVADDRCSVGVTDIQTDGTKIEEAFSCWMTGFKGSLDIKGLVAKLLPNPKAISFDYPIQTIHEAFKVPSDELGMKIACAHHFDSCRPTTKEKIFGGKEDPLYGMFQQSMQTVELFDKIPISTIEAEADKEGCPETILDYAFRLLFGVGCETQRKLGRLYAIKSIEDSNTSVTTKATAHGLLLLWYESSFPEGALPKRYVYMACHHAAEILRLLKDQDLYSRVVIDFVRNVYTKLAHGGGYADLLYHYLELGQFESDVRDLQRSARAQGKRTLKKPLHYACANVECKLQADAGKAFPQCSGKCDPDKKPSYCGAECQRQDWKNHKPYCKPRMPCSVLQKEPTIEDVERRLWGPLYDEHHTRDI